MSYLSDKTLKSMGFRRLGEAVQISDKASIHNCELIEIGDNTRIDDFVVLSGRIEIGRNVHIAVFCNVAGGSEGVFLSDFSGLAYGCQIFSQSDDYSGRTMTNPTVPGRFKRETKRAVHIGRHCIVGASSVIFPGVNLAEGCAVGAMSMVTKSTRPWGVYFGLPAKRINERRQDLLVLEKQFLAEQAISEGK